MQSKATTVRAYLRDLPPDRRQAVGAVRKVILDNLDKDYEEGMCYGMIAYSVPHRVYPAGYHCNPGLPLPFAGLASQKQYTSVYLMTCYAGGTPDEGWFRKAWAATGKKLDMGKCRIRFERVEDPALEVIGGAIRRLPVQACIEVYEQALTGSSKTGAKKLAAAKKKAAAGGRANSAASCPRKEDGGTEAGVRGAGRRVISVRGYQRCPGTPRPRPRSC